VKLTDLSIRKAKPGARDYRMADGGGLTLLVRANESKLWRWRYRFAGKEKQLAIGAYPDVSLSEAREARDRARKILRAGRDPSTEKRREERDRQAAGRSTFEATAREWHALNQSRWTKVHAADVLTSLERDVFPRIGHLALVDIDSPTVLEALRPIERRGAVETAHRLRQRISAVFALAKSQGLVAHDPAADVGAALKRKPRARKQPAAVELEQLREILLTTERSGAYPVTLLASRLLALTAVRPGTLRRAEWSEFENLPVVESTTQYEVESTTAIWRIPAEKMKLEKDRKDEVAFDHVVPLAPAAVDVLRAAHQLTGNCTYVFPGQRHAHRPLSENAIGYLYNRCGWHGRHVPHGWRAAFSTVMNERRPVDRFVIDAMLAHVPKDKVEAAYNRAEHMERRREIANEWAALLMEGLPPAEDLLGVARRLTNETAWG
jgi:integrase